MINPEYALALININIKISLALLINFQTIMFEFKIRMTFCLKIILIKTYLTHKLSKIKYVGLRNCP